MKHVKALLIKFVMIAVILEIVLYMLAALTFIDILYISLAVTILAYIIGDLLILPASNNTTATIVDVVLSLMTIYAFNFIWTLRHVSFTISLIAAVIIGIGEWFFHKYMANNVLHEHKAE